jgi:predicted SnoaL-like aldol condensation-catalyzing enzyme
MRVVSLKQFSRQYTDEVYHTQDPAALERFVADPCIRHEHGHRLSMSLAENRARVAGFLQQCKDPRFEFIVEQEEGEYYSGVYQFTFEGADGPQTLSGIEIFRVVDGKITETWNAAAGEGPWG